jgi:hypothetical protein
MKNVQLYISVLCVLAGIALLYTGLLLPPEGEISPSVLVAYGETLTFAGSVIGVDYHYRFNNKNKPPRGAFPTNLNNNNDYGQTRT